MSRPKKQTVGYRYYVNLHFALCMGPVACERIRIGGRDIVGGDSGISPLVSGSWSRLIDRPGLFGGDAREGGVRGRLAGSSGNGGFAAPWNPEFWPGDHPLNADVCQILFQGDAISGRAFYVGNNPYLKPIEFRVSRFYTGRNGSTAVIEQADSLDAANPADIIWEALTNTRWGMGFSTGDMDGTSFDEAGQALFDEGLGLSLLWSDESPIHEFVQEIARHIDAVLYVHPETGKFTLRLIRDDYDAGTALLLHTDDSIIAVKRYARTAAEELVNMVTVRYWDHDIGGANSVAVADGALRASMGREVGAVIEYPGVTSRTLAARLAERDLRSMARELLTVELECTRVAGVLMIGDVFRFEAPDYHDGQMVMRVTELRYGDSGKHRILVKAVEDSFATPITSTYAPQASGWTPPTFVADVPNDQFAQEATYYELARAEGQSAVDDALAADPNQGMLMVAVSRGGTALNATLWVDDGAGFDEAATVDFSASAALAADVGFTATAWTITGGQDLDRVEAGSYAAIGREFVRIDAINTTTGALTVGRGVHDTTPKAHAAGDRVLFLSDYLESDGVVRTAEEVIEAKLQPVGSTAAVDITTIDQVEVTFQHRAIRPYPPGKFRIGGSAYPGSLPSASTVTWAHRDRTLQTGDTIIDEADGNVGPEDGTEYAVLIYGPGGVLAHAEGGLTGTSYAYSVASCSRVEVWSFCGGHVCLWPACIGVAVPDRPLMYGELSCYGGYGTVPYGEEGEWDEDGAFIDFV